MNTSDHIVKSFDEDLAQIEALVMEMGGVVEQQILESIQALMKCNTELAEAVIQNDKRVDMLENEIDVRTIQVLALRQPMAEDLRAIIASLKIAGNLERIGDYAKNIAKRASTLTSSQVQQASATTLRRMSELVQEMTGSVLDAYSDRDAEGAEDVRVRDEDVDRLHNTLFRELLTYMMEDPRSISACMHLLFIAKNVERMGDHTTSIAEQVLFMVRGAMPEEERRKGDNTSYTLVEDKTGKKAK